MLFVLQNPIGRSQSLEKVEPKFQGAYDDYDSIGMHSYDLIDTSPPHKTYIFQSKIQKKIN
jgi:hypothetical protein